MTREAFIERRFSVESEALIAIANKIIAEYEEIGLTLTLRQLYYQFVSRDVIPNNQRSYKRLGSVINDARLAGRVDWEAIEDRTRNLEALPHWRTPDEIVRACAEQFNIDLWSDQENRVEVWIEKDALTGVIENVCREYDVPYFSCRGYTSQSEQWRASTRFMSHSGDGQHGIILHLGDHDPSGIDMTRDNDDRLNQVFGVDVEVRRLALNFDQVQLYNPPPNFAKDTDSRFAGYKVQYGEESWELDALDPRVMQRLVEDAIRDCLDEDLFAAKKAERDTHRAKLLDVANGLSGTPTPKKRKR